MRQQAVVILKIGAGSLEQGFAFTLRVSHPDRLKQSTWDGKLPPAPAVQASFQHWTGMYGSLGQGTLIRIPTVQVTNVDRVDDCREAADALAAAMNRWLMQESVFEALSMRLLQALPQAKGLKFFVQTDDPILLRLPWQVWKFLEKAYPDAEVILSSDFQPNAGRLKLPVKVLAIEGDTSGTQAQLDVTAIEQIPGMQVTLLKQPTQEALLDQLWHASWDMLLFMGHSRSQARTGEISLNETETLSLDDLHDALQFSVDNGLKFALFNSCDGVGIAAKLADLKIPYTIVMRQPIPDVIAQMFLKTFLTSFSRGKSVNQSVHAARCKLKESKTRLPYASWLPVIYQNPAAPELCYPRRLAFPRWWKYSAVAVVAAGAAALAISSWNKPVSPPPAADDPAITQKQKAQTLYAQRHSYGTKLLGDDYSAIERQQLQAPLQAFQEGRYEAALQGFQVFLETHECPEINIYASNAKIRLSNKVSLGAIVASVPLGGKSPTTAQEMLRGIAQAQQEALTQGRNIEVMVLADGNGKDQDNKPIMKVLAESVVTDAQVRAVIGPNASDAARDAAELYDSKRVLMVTPTAFFDRLGGQGDFVYRMLPKRAEFIQPLTQYVQRDRYGTGAAGICTDQRSNDNQGVGEAFEESLSKRAYMIDNCIVDAEHRPKTDDEIMGMLQKLQQENINTILIAPHIEYLPDALRVAALAQQMKFQLLGTATFYGNRVIADAATARTLEGMELYVPWSPTKALNAGNNPFATKWEKNVTWRTATSYDAFTIIAQGLAKIPPAAPKDKSSIQTVRRDLKRFFKSVDHRGVSGRTQFRGDKGDRLNDFPYGELLTIGKNAQGRWQYLPAPKAIPPKMRN